MKINKFFTFAALAAAMFLASCAEQAKRIPATYIPSIIYRGASCQELAQERRVLADYVNTVTRAQRGVARADTVLVTTSLVIFWPAIFALPLTVDQSAQLATARGHYDALIKAQAEQGCGGRHGHAAPGGGYAQQPVYTLPAPNWKRYPGQFPPL